MLRHVPVLLALAVACDDRPPRHAAASPVAKEVEVAPPACPKDGPTGTQTRSIEVLGKKRSYALVVPPSRAADERHPLVVVLHGHGGTGAQARSAFDLEGGLGGSAIFAYPDALRGGWDLDTPASRNGDVALFDAILALTNVSHCLDLGRVFVVGFSNGAYMANQLACRRGARIRGVVSHSGGGPYETSGGKYDDEGALVCDGKPVASLVLHGATDGTVLPSEGQKSIDHHSRANHCSGTDGHAPCAAHRGCANPVVACKIAGLGHAIWPQAQAMIRTFLEGLR